MTTPPNGRAMKPIPKVANDASVPATSDTCGKNCGANTVAAAVP